MIIRIPIDDDYLEITNESTSDFWVDLHFVSSKHTDEDCGDCHTIESIPLNELITGLEAMQSLGNKATQRDILLQKLEL